MRRYKIKQQIHAYINRYGYGQTWTKMDNEKVMVGDSLTYFEICFGLQTMEITPQININKPYSNPSGIPLSWLVLKAGFP